MPLFLPHDRLRISPCAASRVVHGATILLNTETGQSFALDGVGIRVWSLLGVSSSTDDVREALLAEYHVEPERLQQDLEAFLTRLQDEGLLEAQRG